VFVYRNITRGYEPRKLSPILRRPSIGLWLEQADTELSKSSSRKRVEVRLLSGRPKFMWACGGMAYAGDLKSSGRKAVRVRVSPSPPSLSMASCGFYQSYRPCLIARASTIQFNPDDAEVIEASLCKRFLSECESRRWVQVHREDSCRTASHRRTHVLY
jgi:hypothetical protein